MLRVKRSWLTTEAKKSRRRKVLQPKKLAEPPLVYRDYARERGLSREVRSCRDNSSRIRGGGVVGGGEKEEEKGGEGSAVRALQMSDWEQ